MITRQGANHARIARPIRRVLDVALPAKVGKFSSQLNPFSQPAGSPLHALQRRRQQWQHYESQRQEAEAQKEVTVHFFLSGISKLSSSLLGRPRARSTICCIICLRAEYFWPSSANASWHPAFEGLD